MKRECGMRFGDGVAIKGEITSHLRCHFLEKLNTAN